MSLTIEQRKALRDCPECGHTVWPPTPHEFGHNIGLRICTGGDCACGMDLHHVNTTYENVEALLSETVAAMRAELDATHTTIAHLRNAIGDMADGWAHKAHPDDENNPDCAGCWAEDLQALLDGGA